jgi:hypothetical protein
LLGHDDDALRFATEAVVVARQVADDLARLAGLLARTIELNRNDWPAAIDAELNPAITLANAGHTQDAIETAKSAGRRLRPH